MRISHSMNRRFKILPMRFLYRVPRVFQKPRTPESPSRTVIETDKIGLGIPISRAKLDPKEQMLFFEKKLEAIQNQLFNINFVPDMLLDHDCFYEPLTKILETNLMNDFSNINVIPNTVFDNKKYSKYMFEIIEKILSNNLFNIRYVPEFLFDNNDFLEFLDNNQFVNYCAQGNGLEESKKKLNSIPLPVPNQWRANYTHGNKKKQVIEKLLQLLETAQKNMIETAQQALQQVQQDGPEVTTRLDPVTTWGCLC